MTETGKIGIASDDATHCRLLQSATAHLGFQPVLLTANENGSSATLSGLEMIVAEPALARQLRSVTRSPGSIDDPYRPAIIAITTDPEVNRHSEAEEPFDGLLLMPQSPAAVAVQLSIAIYAHRAFARRYENAMEELALNRQIFHSVTNGISVANATLPDMPLTYVNPAFEVMTGYSLEDVLGKNCRFLQGKDHDQPGLVLIREAIREGREIVAVLRNYRKSGTPFWNELTLSPIRGRDGAVMQFVGVQADVTARIDLEHALRESEKLAVAGRLAASIAHEINNPLESVTNLVYLAQTSQSAEESKGYLAQVDGELRRIKLITSQSLRFYKQSTGPQAVLLSELLDAALDLGSARILSAGVTIERRDRVHRHIVCMESEIRRVIHNLITNATDAMKVRGGGRLLLRTREVLDGATGRTAGRCGVVLTVADTGTGIPKDSLGEIYRAFYSTKGLQGTGLGLWISSEIIARHRGELSVRSRSTGTHTGTVFRLYLPFQGASPEMGG